MIAEILPIIAVTIFIAQILARVRRVNLGWGFLVLDFAQGNPKDFIQVDKEKKELED